MADRDKDSSSLKSLFDQVTSEDSTPLKMRCILEAVGRNVKADRCYVYFVRDLAKSLWDNVYEWCADGVPSIMGNQQGVDMAGFPDMLEAITSGMVWSFCDVEKTHPCTRAKLKPQGIKAIIIAPFRDADGKVSGCVGFDFVNSHPSPIPAHVVRNLVEAVNMITSCLRFKREQDIRSSTDNILLEIGIGVWSFELDDGVPPRMYGDRQMDELLGCDGPSLTPEEYYNAWYDNIHPSHYPEIRKTLDNLIAGRQAEVQYPFMHPTRGKMWVRCGGRRDWNYKKGVRIIGRHQDITELLHVQKDNEAEFNAIQRLADNERDRADKERDINMALELLVQERDFTRVLNKLMSVWCRALDAQWSILGKFVEGGFKVVHCHSAFGDQQIFRTGDVLTYLPDVSGEEQSGPDGDFVSIVDFQDHPIAETIAKMSDVPSIIRNAASCHSRIIRFEGKRWGTIVLLFQNRHEFTENEQRFVAASAHGIELALLRSELEARSAAMAHTVQPQGGQE